MDPDAPKLGRVSAAFLLAAAIAILFNTVLACAKDAYSPLRTLMTALSDHDWTTQGLADVLLFVALGLIFFKDPPTGSAESESRGLLPGCRCGHFRRGTLCLVRVALAISPQINSLESD